jgi:hypothetical protein
MRVEDLVGAVESSDVALIGSMREAIRAYQDPWALHLALYPAVQRVLNPPFINPHLPKMYHICRDFFPYLSREGQGALVFLEILEYTRRTKLEKVAPPPSPRSQVAFEDIEKAIALRDRDGTAFLLSSFLAREGWTRLLRRLLLLGSGYLADSLGHSVSCTAFILLELIERPHIDAWPALFLLADYFCKGGFHTTPPLRELPAAPSLADYLRRSVGGTGFIDLHHTITLYAIERTASFFTREEHGHLIAAWAAFMGDKGPSPLPSASAGRVDEYDRFYGSFSKLDAGGVLDLVGGMIGSPEDRSRLCTLLITGVCDLYRGEYDPHYLTGLGALLRLINRYHEDIGLVQNGLSQYLGFYFRGMRPGN